MDSKLARLGLIAAAALIAAANAFAGDTATLNLSATVNGTCKLNGDQTLTFSNNGGSGIDPNSATTATGSGATFQYKCTKGTVPTFKINGVATGSTTGTLTGALASPDTMSATVTWTNPTTAGNGFGTGSTYTNVAVSGSIVAAQFQNVQADTYTGTLPVTIAP
jgi:hypothetical protein